MTRDRAIEIIAAFGADPARWPDDERAAVLALADDPVLATAITEAADLDRDLRRWAAAPVAVGAPLAVVPSRRSPWGWAAGASMAAALLAGVVLIRPATAPIAPVATTVTAANVSDEQAFTLLFTLTPDEETVI